ncbi:hypothetical protein ACA910_018065 [Epithemia clementina (nom. ined.)]
MTGSNQGMMEQRVNEDEDAPPPPSQVPTHNDNDSYDNEGLQFQLLQLYLELPELDGLKYFVLLYDYEMDVQACKSAIHGSCAQ